MKKDYVEFIRKNTAYPTLRSFLSFMVFVGGLAAVGIVVAGYKADSEGSFLISIIAALVVFSLIRIAIDAALTLADTADSTLERGARDWIPPVENSTNLSDISSDEAVKKNAVVNETISCPKCKQANFVWTTNCVSCKAELKA